MVMAASRRVDSQPATDERLLVKVVGPAAGRGAKRPPFPRARLRPARPACKGDRQVVGSADAEGTLSRETGPRRRPHLEVQPTGRRRVSDLPFTGECRTQPGRMATCLRRLSALA